MMTILPNSNTQIQTQAQASQKRSYESLSNEPHQNINNSKRIKSSATVTSSPTNNNNNTTNDFSSKMIIQLVKAAIMELDPSFDNNNTNNNFNIRRTAESPIGSLANTISLPPSNPGSINSINLSLVISHLTSEMAKLDSMHALPLVESILKINWIYHASKNENFSKNYSLFLSVLVSTIPSWWKTVASKIIQDFPKSNEIILSDHHETLKKLISLAPTSSNSLPTLLKLNFPNKTSPKDEIVNYIKNLLKVSSYYDVLINFVWSLIFENFIKLDVELQNQIDEVDDDNLAEVLGLEESDEEESDDDEEVDEDDDDQEDVSDDDNESGDEMDEDTNNFEPSNKKSNKKILKKVTFDAEDLDDQSDDEEMDDEMLDSEEEYKIELESLSDLSLKLDSILSYLLSYLKPNLSVDALESGHGIPTFSALTSSFRSMILPTHGTKATQYIIFYAAQQQPELIDAFLVALFEIAFSSDKKSPYHNNSSNFSSNYVSLSSLSSRITGIQYIASFVARATQLSTTQIVSVVTFLVDYCAAYMEEHADDYNEEIDHNNNTHKEREFNPMKHAVFYSLVQALMYIVCFRKDSLREPEFQTFSNKQESNQSSSNSSSGWVASLDKFFTRVIVSKYDPLRWCNETVVLIFSRVAQSEGICYTWSVIERIRRERVGRNTTTNNNNDTIPSSGNIESTVSSISTNVTVGTQSSMRATQEFLDLVAVFPFDPLLLKKSRKIVQDTYLEWNNGDDEEEEEEEEED